MARVRLQKFNFPADFLNFQTKLFLGFGQRNPGNLNENILGLLLLDPLMSVGKNTMGNCKPLLK